MIQLRIVRTAFGGDGISSHEGKTCFVEGGLPGELVEAELVRDKKDFMRFRATRILESSAHRVQPPCLHYGFCGGCQYQHVSYEEELRLKQTQLKDILKKIAGLDLPVETIIHGRKDYGYRRSVTFHVGSSGKNKAPQLCFIAKDNVSKIPVKSCDLLD